MKRICNDPDAYLDFYQIHSYGWMSPSNHHPYSRSFDDLNLDKPAMIGKTVAIEMIPPKDSSLPTTPPKTPLQ